MVVEFLAAVGIADVAPTCRPYGVIHVAVALLPRPTGHRHGMVHVFQHLLTCKLDQVVVAADVVVVGLSRFTDYRAAGC